MPWNMDDPNPPRRFYFESDGEENNGEWIELRICSADDTKNISDSLGVAQHEKMVLNSKTGRMERVVWYDITPDVQKKLDDEVNKFIIYDWYISTDKGDIIPCDDDKKLFMMNKVPVFATRVNGFMKQLRKEVEEMIEDEIKN